MYNVDTITVCTWRTLIALGSVQSIYKDAMYTVPTQAIVCPTNNKHEIFDRSNFGHYFIVYKAHAIKL